LCMDREVLDMRITRFASEFNTPSSGRKVRSVSLHSTQVHVLSER
jgi:hypothetical protein